MSEKTQEYFTTNQKFPKKRIILKIRKVKNDGILNITNLDDKKITATQKQIERKFTPNGIQQENFDAYQANVIEIAKLLQREEKL